MESTAIAFTMYYFSMGYLRSLNYFHSNSIATEYREANGFEYLIPLAYKIIGFGLVGFAVYFSYAFKWWAGPIVWIVNYLFIAPILGNMTLKLFGISLVRFFSWVALILYFSIIHELLNIKF